MCKYLLFLCRILLKALAGNYTCILFILINLVIYQFFTSYLDLDDIMGELQFKLLMDLFVVECSKNKKKIKFSKKFIKRVIDLEERVIKKAKEELKLVPSGMDVNHHFFIGCEYSYRHEDQKMISAPLISTARGAIFISRSYRYRVVKRNYLNFNTFYKEIFSKFYFTTLVLESMKRGKVVGIAEVVERECERYIKFVEEQQKRYEEDFAEDEFLYHKFYLLYVNIDGRGATSYAYDTHTEMPVKLRPWFFFYAYLSRLCFQPIPPVCQPWLDEKELIEPKTSLLLPRLTHNIRIKKPKVYVEKHPIYFYDSNFNYVFDGKCWDAVQGYLHQLTNFYRIVGVKYFPWAPFSLSKYDFDKIESSKFIEEKAEEYFIEERRSYTEGQQKKEFTYLIRYLAFLDYFERVYKKVQEVQICLAYILFGEEFIKKREEGAQTKEGIDLYDLNIFFQDFEYARRVWHKCDNVLIDESRMWDWKKDEKDNPACIYLYKHLLKDDARGYKEQVKERFKLLGDNVFEQNETMKKVAKLFLRLFLLNQVFYTYYASILHRGTPTLIRRHYMYLEESISKEAIEGMYKGFLLNRPLYKFAEKYVLEGTKRDYKWFLKYPYAPRFFIDEGLKYLVDFIGYEVEIKKINKDGKWEGRIIDESGREIKRVFWE